MTVKSVLIASALSAGGLTLMFTPIGIGPAAGAAGVVAAIPAARAVAAPEFPSLAKDSWVGNPASLASLRGHVVMLSVWTFG